MISLSLISVFVLYVAITILSIIIVSFYDKGSRRKFAVIIDKTLFDCPICAYRYIVSNTEKIHKCPQCGSLNTQMSS